MAKIFQRFEIEGIGRIETNPTVYVADCDFAFGEDLEGSSYGNNISVRVRFKHDSGDTVQSLEQKIFEEARDLLALTLRQIDGETSESLFQRNKRMEAEFARGLEEEISNTKV